MTPPRAALLPALALAGCSGPAGLEREGTPTILRPGATSLPTATAAAGTATTPAPAALPTDLEDGERHYAYARRLDTTERTLTVDVVQFLTGRAGVEAAEEDGEEPFDYYIRNQNRRLRTLTLAPGVKVTVNTLTAGESGSSAQDTRVSLAKLASYFASGEAQQRVFWFTLKGGAVVTLHEQFTS